MQESSTIRPYVVELGLAGYRTSFLASRKGRTVSTREEPFSPGDNTYFDLRGIPLRPSLEIAFLERGPGGGERTVFGWSYLKARTAVDAKGKALGALMLHRWMPTFEDIDYVNFPAPLGVEAAAAVAASFIADVRKDTRRPASLDASIVLTASVYRDESLDRLPSALCVVEPYWTVYGK